MKTLKVRPPHPGGLTSWWLTVVCWVTGHRWVDDGSTRHVMFGEGWVDYRWRCARCGEERKTVTYIRQGAEDV